MLSLLLLFGFSSAVTSPVSPATTTTTTTSLTATRVCPLLTSEQELWIRVFKGFRLKRFRSIDGFGNNVANPKWGQSFTDKIRIAPQELPEHQWVMSGVPSGRVISNAIHDQPPKTPANPFGSSAWIWAFGQFIDHDVAAETELGGDDIVEYCAHASCSAPISVPTNDPHFGPFGVTSFSFHRTGYNLGKNSFTSNTFMPADRRFFPERKYPNVITHWVDASTVYGSTKVQTERLRDLTCAGRGRLKTETTGLFPPKVETVPGSGKFEFLVGDVRGNENLILISIHTLFVREHNRIADKIWVARGMPSACNRACNDDIFEHARAVLIGLMQKITYEEWLPQFLGPDFFKKFVGKWNGYQPLTDPSQTMEFTAAAFRIGHTLVNNELWRVDEHLKPVKGGPIKLADAFFQDAMSLANNPQEMVYLLLGLGAQKSENADAFVVDALRNMLFGQGAAGSDLTALNAQRNRDNGNERFKTVRHYLCKYTLQLSATICPPFNSFSDFHGSVEVQKILKKLYGTPDQVELFVGGLLESHAKGAHVGPTFGWLLAEQFRRARDGDRFWYENYLPSSIVKIIKQETLAKVLSRNLGVKVPQTNVFVAH